MRFLAMAMVVVCACGPAAMTGDAGGSGGGVGAAGGAAGGGSVAGGSTAGGSTAGGSTAGGSTAGGSTAGGSAGGGSAGGSFSLGDGGLRVCEPARPTTSCDDIGGPLSGVAGDKGTCIRGGAACECTLPYVVNPVTGRCRAAERQPVCNRYDGIQCMPVLADGGFSPTSGTCGTMTIPAGCGCVYDFRTASFRAECTRTCTPTIPGDTDCFALNCGTIACLDNTRCRAANTCRP